MEQDLLMAGLQFCVLLAGFFGGMNFAFWLRRPDQDTAVCARRYRWLRARPFDSITAGGIFIGVTGERTGGWVINGDDADRAVDAAMEADPPDEMLARMCKRSLSGEVLLDNTRFACERALYEDAQKFAAQNAMWGGGETLESLMADAKRYRWLKTALYTPKTSDDIDTMIDEFMVTKGGLGGTS